MAQQSPSPLDGTGLRVAVLGTGWYADVVASLREGALATLSRLGVKDDDVLLLDVPGAFELPQAAAWIARAGMADAIVALGCVVRGETPHFEYVCSACTQGLVTAGVTTGIPVAMGVITADTIEQARARSGGQRGGAGEKGGNKGVEAAEAAVALACAYRALERRDRR
jgi:6,7-dimethyl-8-ribityllumazine synthase